jgi:hypothetical protein
MGGEGGIGGSVARGDRTAIFARTAGFSDLRDESSAAAPFMM